jgi:hypothetical protein
MCIVLISGGLDVSAKENNDLVKVIFLHPNGPALLQHS